MLPFPPRVSVPDDPAHGPLLNLVSDVLISSAALAAHWGYTDNHLSNLRRNTGAGLPFVKLPTGGIRYRMSEVLAAEIAGTVGPLSVDRAILAVSACTAVPAEHRAVMLAHLKVALGGARS